MLRADSPFPADTAVRRVLGRLRDVAANPGVPPAVLTWLDSGQLQPVEEVLAGLLATRRPTYAMVRAFREILERLAGTPGPGSVAAVLRIADRARATVADRTADRRTTSPGPWLRNGDRDVAAWLADGRPLEHLAPVFATAGPDDELAACLLQEAVWRHGDLTQVVEAVAFADRLSAAGHPLGRLPVWLLPTERWYAPARFKSDRMPDRSAAPAGPRPRTVPAPDRLQGPELQAVEVEWPAEIQARQTFQDYQIASGSEAESRLYLLDRPIAPAEFGVEALLGLGADCLTGATPQQVHAWRADAGEVWAALFEQSVVGGPSGRGRGSAYSRLMAWGALAALCDDAAGEPDEVERAAAECTWLLFDAESPWYLQVHFSLDVGIAGLRSDRQTVVILAATDSD